MSRPGEVFRKWPFENIIADICFIVVNFFFIHEILFFTYQFYGYFLIIAIPFQLICLFVAPIISFYKEGSDPDDHSWFNRTGSALLFASIIFTIAVGCAWFFLPLEAFKQISGKDIAGTPLLPVMVIGYLLFSLIAIGYGNYFGEEKVNHGNEVWYRYVSAFIVLIFLIFLESMLKTTLTILSENNALDIGQIGYLIWALLAFLPLRLLLLLRPPFTLFEFIMFFCTTGFFVYRILTD